MNGSKYPDSMSPTNHLQIHSLDEQILQTYSNCSVKSDQDLVESFRSAEYEPPRTPSPKQKETGRDKKKLFLS